MPKRKTARRKLPSRKPDTPRLLQELNDVALEISMDIGAMRITMERLANHFIFTMQPDKDVTIAVEEPASPPEAEPDQQEAQEGDSPQPPVGGG